MNGQKKRNGAEIEPRKTVADTLEGMRPQLERALAGKIPIDYFLRVALTEVQQDSRLMQAGLRSFTFAMLEAAQLRLPLDGHLGYAYLVPFWSKKNQSYNVQLMTGYKGLMHMARRSGEIGKIEPRVVYAGDHFDHAYGLEQKLVHVPVPSAERGPWTHVYAIAHYLNGSPPQFEVMPQADVFAIRDRSPGGKSDKTTPWDTDEIPMALKCPIRKLCKWLPMGIEEQRQITKEEMFDARVPDYDVKTPPLEISELASTEDAPDPEGEGEPEESGEADAINKQVRAVRHVYEAGVTRGIWNAQTFREKWIVGKLGLAPAGKTLDHSWLAIADGLTSERIGKLIDEMQEVILAAKPEDPPPATEDAPFPPSENPAPNKWEPGPEGSADELYGDAPKGDPEG